MNADPSLRKNWAAVKRGEVFTSLNTAAEDWSYEGGCEHVDQEVQCELCETMINYRFPLTHKSTGKALKVGRECIVNYYEAYIPDGLTVMFAMMDLAFKTTKKAVIAKKLAEFRHAHPAVVAFLLDTFDSKRREFRSVVIKTEMPLASGFDSTSTGTVMLDSETVSTSKFRAALKRRGYLKPAEIEALKPNVDRWINSSPTAQGLVDVSAKAA